MSKFIGYLDTRLIDEFDDIHYVLPPIAPDPAFAFASDLLKETITPEPWFRTDFASVPRLVGMYLFLGNKGKRAAVIHDWLYSLKKYPRKVCDAVFREALIASGYRWLVVGLMYAGVRLGGGSYWTKPNVPQEQHVQEVMDAGELVAP